MTSPQPVTDELKPCPFCGSDRVSYVNRISTSAAPDSGYIRCIACGAGEAVLPYREAIAAWNTRAPQPTLREDEAVGKLAAAHRALMAAQQKGEK